MAPPSSLSYPMGLQLRDVASNVALSATMATSSDRTLFNIIWSCSVTLFACIWTSIHPNIPGPDDSSWQITRRRVLIAIYALIAPEIVAIWALRQYFAAQKIADVFNSELRTLSVQEAKMRSSSGSSGVMNAGTWTRSHGFFMQMGGVLLHDATDKPLQVLGVDNLITLLRSHKISISELSFTDREIHDKSKGDAISKGVVVLQTTWFVAQASGRVYHGLPLSALETMTLAFAVLNAAVYAIWWKKPQAVEVPIRARLRSLTKDVQITTESAAEESFSVKRHYDEPKEDHTIVSAQTAYRGPPSDTEPIGYLDRAHNDKPHRSRTSLSGSIKEFILWLSIPCQCALYPAQKMAISDTIPPNALRVPMFYADPRWRDQTTAIVFTGPALGAVFGALHLLAWSETTFSTSAELIIWRTASVIITAVPVSVIIVGLAGDIKGRRTGKARYTIPSLTFALTLPIYALARLSLVILALISLRALPSQAFIQLSWASWIPHF